MRISIVTKLVAICFTSALLFSPLHAAPLKNWTFLIYINGNNSLDYWASENLRAMEKSGSDDQVNIVAQWASLSRGTSVRMLVQKSTDPSQVTSPILQDLGYVDMGNYQSLQDFIKWGVENFPAQHYFIDVWNHGNGWHYLVADSRNFTTFSPNDISWDEISGNHITTEQLGQAMSYAAGIIGHKVDLYGSDACLMAMAEVADEMSDSVSYFAGSQEVEPGAGWPYAELLSRWQATPNASADVVAKMLADEYVKSYQGGSGGTMQVTFSAFDLSKLPALNQAISALGKNIQNLNATDRKKVHEAARETQSFADRDYGDLIDFTGKLKKANIPALNPDVIANVTDTANQFIIANYDTTYYSAAHGASIWLPVSQGDLQTYLKRYKGLKFHEHTLWGDALEAFGKDAS